MTMAAEERQKLMQEGVHLLLAQIATELKVRDGATATARYL